MGTLSQTKYRLSDSASGTTIIRHHHPLIGQKLKLLSVGKTMALVRLPDGSSMKIPRRWTDVDGVACPELAGVAELTLHGLHELISLFMALRERARNNTVIASEMIAQSNMEAVDDQAETVGVSRASESRDAVGAVSQTSQRRGHTTVCTVDGARDGDADSSVENKKTRGAQ